MYDIMLKFCITIMHITILFFCSLSILNKKIFFLCFTFKRCFRISICSFLQLNLTNFSKCIFPSIDVEYCIYRVSSRQSFRIRKTENRGETFFFFSIIGTINDECKESYRNDQCKLTALGTIIFIWIFKQLKTHSDNVFFFFTDTLW